MKGKRGYKGLIQGERYGEEGVRGLNGLKEIRGKEI